MLRRIATFEHGADDRWVARLACGHAADPERDALPPAPEWSRSEHGRQNLIGSLARCRRCAAGEPPVPAPLPLRASRPRRRRRWFGALPPATPEPHWVTTRIASGRIASAVDLERAARDGFRTVICLSVAGEPGQALAPSVEASWARALGLAFSWLPVDPGRIRERDVTRFLDTIDDAAGPALVHAHDDGRADAFCSIALGRRSGWSAMDVLRAAAARGLRLSAACAALVERHVGAPSGARVVSSADAHCCHPLRNSTRAAPTPP